MYVCLFLGVVVFVCLFADLLVCVYVSLHVCMYVWIDKDSKRSPGPDRQIVSAPFDAVPRP